MKWSLARKKPVVVEFREVIPNNDSQVTETIKTREGSLLGYLGRDVIIRGVEGEIYPCDKKIFAKTYSVLKD